MFSASISQLSCVVLRVEKDKLLYSVIHLGCFNCLLEGGMTCALEIPLSVYWQYKTERMSWKVSVHIYWIHLNSLALFWTPEVKKRKTNSRSSQGSSYLPKLVVPQSTWNTNCPVYSFCMFSAGFPFCFPQWCLGLKCRVYLRSGCFAWVWGCKGDISSQGHLAVLGARLGPFFLRCSGITCWDLLVAAKFQVWADVQILSAALLLSISTALLYWGRCGPCPQDTFSH